MVVLQRKGSGFAVSDVGVPGLNSHPALVLSRHKWSFRISVTVPY